jgi:restriction system protein
MFVEEEDLIQGEYYISCNHGIGRYDGIRYIDNNEGKSEKYYIFTYAREQSLYVPSEQIDIMKKYYGHLGLSTLGGHKDWNIEYKKNLKNIQLITSTQEAQFRINAYKNILLSAVENDEMNGKKQIINSYINGETLNDFIGSVLEKSTYPEGYTKNVEVDYEPSSKTVVVNYRIPNVDEVPKIVEYRCNSRTGRITEVLMKDKEFNDYYESIVFQITLRSVKEIFDSANNYIVETIVFNGFVDKVDNRKGSVVTACIISLMVLRSKFEEINLIQVSVKDCIKYLKAIFVGQLHQLYQVKPILYMNKIDSRFIENKDVLSEINEVVNLAEIDWKDFEYLVRELFEKVFSVDGSEVKITQASRDGGVDVVAFDNDPIKGGKFVIQAKRYNNVVPVSAVRDLYGTVINEGAVKGILVTTSYFGNDSREFSKDKPITLIDGTNLIYLMNQYGYKAHINLK